MEHKLEGMDTLFYKSYYKYFRWNKGLIEHYLSDKRSHEDIKLYVDAEVLARIGLRMKIGDYSDDKEYVEDFMESVEAFCNYYNKYNNYGCPLPLPEDPKVLNREGREKAAKARVKCPKTQCKKESCVLMKCIERDGKSGFDFARPDFLAVAKHISCKECVLCKAICKESDEFNDENKEKCLNEGIAYYHKYYDQSGNIKIKMDNGKAEKFDLPFFAIVVYIILRFDEQEILKWNNLTDRTYEKQVVDENDQLTPKSYKSYLRIANGSRPYINDLWAKIYCYNKRFNKDAVIYDSEPYASRIKYHTPLSSPLRRRINDAIYLSGIWNSYDTLSFQEQLSRIREQIPDNSELSRILKECFANAGYKDIYKNRIKDLLERFDIDEYRNGLEERKRKNQPLPVLQKGRFALAIFCPTIESGKKNEIRLYTDITEKMTIGDYEIPDQTFSLYGYNGTPVKCKGNTSVGIKDHSFKNKKNGIKIEAVSHNYDVMFFYTRDEDYETQLYFQTEELVPAKSYFVVVNDDETVKQTFEKWCEENGNNPQIQEKEYTAPLFGNDWIVYYKEGNWNGQYHQSEEDINGEINNKDEETIEYHGGIKNSDGNYFINSLPYFEIPEKYEIDQLKVYLIFDYYESTRPAEEREYRILHNDRRLIIDLLDTSSLGSEFRCVVGLEYDKKSVYSFDFKVNGQDISFQQEKLCKFNKWGNIASSDDWVISGNKFAGGVAKNVEGGYLISGLERLTQVPENAYLINLLSAFCYDKGKEKGKAEMRPEDFKKCISYATTRFKNVEEVSIDLIENALVTAGFINIDYSRNPKRYQIVPPAFTRVPYAYKKSGDIHQLYMLTGAYTKTFLDDLIYYCQTNGIGIYYKAHQRKNSGAIDNLIPSPILLEYDFKPADFLVGHPHHCDVFEKQDLAYSLLSNVVSAKEVFNSYRFQQYDDCDFLLYLDETKDMGFPRIRKDKNSSYNKNWYLEKESKYFCKIDRSLLEWAYLYCYLRRFNVLMVVDKNRRNTIYLPHSLQLPWLVRRSLYMMNMGLPEIVNSFVCSSGREDVSFQKMDKYVLASDDRTDLVAKVLINDESKVRESFENRNLKLEFWQPKQKLGKCYLVLKGTSDSIIAVACKMNSIWCVFVNDRGELRETEGTVNEVFSYLIEKEWQFNPVDNPQTLHTSVGIRNNYVYTPVFKILTESIDFPDKNDFDTNNNITIL